MPHHGHLSSICECDEFGDIPLFYEGPAQPPKALLRDEEPRSRWSLDTEDVVERPQLTRGAVALAMRFYAMGERLLTGNLPPRVPLSSSLPSPITTSSQEPNALRHLWEVLQAFARRLWIYATL